jgi:DNA-damage-inducible protein D
MEQNDKIVLFQEQKIRREWHDGDWYFALIDVIAVLTDSADPQQYLKRMRSRDAELNSYMGTNCTYVDFKGQTGKTRKYLSANTEGVFRIMMSIPSPKAEPFRLWLARVGRERLEEIQDPELGFERLKEIYKAKGYPDDWIERRMQTIETRKLLTEEWKGRGVKEGQEYAILTAQIAKATFGLTPLEHSKLKGLERQNLRDHMTPLELIFTALGEETTRQFAIREDAQGFNENHEAAQKGGKATGNVRENYETNTGLKVVSEENYLNKIDTSKSDDKLLSDDSEK